MANLRILGTILAPALLLYGSVALSQQPMPRDYRGVQINIGGIYVTPVANAPFTAKVEIVSHEVLPDGSVNIRTSIAHVARSSSGRIYNELRQLVPPSVHAEPALISAHIYDPSSNTNIFYYPRTHIARQMATFQEPRPPANSVPGRTPANNPYFKQEDIGTQTLSGLTLTGIRKTRTVPAAVSGTGKDVLITDEYWFSPDLSIYVIIKHDDPRTGEQLVAVTEVDRHEPDQALLSVPPDYKLVDETPAQ